MQKTLTRVFIYLIGFFLPPILIGTLFSTKGALDIMVPHDYDGSWEMNKIPKMKIDKTKPNVLILLGTNGTQITELLSAYETFSRAELFNVITVGEKKEPLKTTSALHVVPDRTFENAPFADIIVVPSLLDPTEKPISRWLEKSLPTAHLVVTLGEGIRPLLPTGLLQSRKVTSHFMALSRLKELYPETEFVEGQTSVLDTSSPDTPILSSFGLATTVEASLKAISYAKGSKVAKQIASEIEVLWLSKKPRQNIARPTDFGLREFFQILLHGGFDWIKKNVGVIVSNGISELGLAASLDTFPRSFSARVVSIGFDQSPVQTLHGLTIFPALAINDAPQLDVLYIPSYQKGKLSEKHPSPLNHPGVKKYLDQSSIFIQSNQHQPSGKAFKNALKFLSEFEDIPIALLVAKVLGVPFDSGENPSTPWGLWLRPLFLSLLGLIFIRLIEHRLIRKRSN